MKLIHEPHVCRAPSNFFDQVPDGTVIECDCGQKYRMKYGRFFWKWVTA